MKNFWIHVIPLFIMAVLAGALLFFQQMEFRHRAENTVIVDLVGDNTNENEIAPAQYVDNRNLSMRHIVDTGGIILIILGIVTLIVAIVGCRLRP